MSTCSPFPCMTSTGVTCTSASTHDNKEHTHSLLAPKLALLCTNIPLQNSTRLSLPCNHSSSPSHTHTHTPHAHRCVRACRTDPCTDACLHSCSPPRTSPPFFSRFGPDRLQLGCPTSAGAAMGALPHLSPPPNMRTCGYAAASTVLPPAHGTAAGAHSGRRSTDVHCSTTRDRAAGAAAAAAPLLSLVEEGAATALALKTCM